MSYLDFLHISIFQADILFSSVALRELVVVLPLVKLRLVSPARPLLTEHHMSAQGINIHIIRRQGLDTLNLLCIIKSKHGPLPHAHSFSLKCQLV